MAFLPNIPLSTDQLSVSQGNILNNFTILGAIAGNSFPSSASLATNSGFNWLYLPSNGAIPPTGSAFNEANVTPRINISRIIIAEIIRMLCS